MAFDFLKDCYGGWRDMGRFGSQAIHGRWFMAFASELIMAFSGANFVFSLYSGEIKSSMGYDQATLNLVSFSKDVGCNVGVHTGLIYEIAPPWVALSIGATINFFGYFMIWLAVTCRMKGVSVWQMCVYICIASNSLSFSNTATLVTCVKNFPESRGVVVGLYTGFGALGGAILTQLYRGFYGKDSKTLILFIACLPAVVFVVFSRTIRVMNLVQLQKEVKVFYNLLCISLSLAGFLMVLIIMENRLSFTRVEYYASAIGVSFFLLLPLAVVIKEEYKLASQRTGNIRFDVLKDQGSTVEVTSETVAKQPQSWSDKPKDNTSCTTNIHKAPSRGEDYTILQAVFCIDMLLLFVTMVCGLGGTMTAIDNMGQIGTTLGYPAESITIFVTLVNIWNFLGRALMGLASEVVLSRYKFPRPMMMTLLLLVSCIGHLLIAFAVPNSLYAASVIIGFCFGAQCPLIHAIISEIFGLKYYSSLYNFVAMAVPLGTYTLNTTLTGKLYDRVALKQLIAKGLRRKPGEALSCVGVECYKLPFLIIAGATLFGCLVSFILVLRTRKFYRGDLYKKFKEVPKVPSTEMSMTAPKEVSNSAQRGSGQNCGNVTLLPTNAQ